jgi:cytidyltransferase-like protein
VSLEGFENIRHRLGKIVCTSLPADPIHPGHLSCLRESTQYGDSLIVIVNGDWFLGHKKGRHFMPLEMRTQIVAGFKGVDVVIPFEIENDVTVCEALKVLRPHVFTKGGDRFDSHTIPEWKVCEDYGIEIITGVGDSKIHSSSNILEDWYEHRLRLFMKA